MLGLKTFASGVVLWAVLAQGARADAISNGTFWEWVEWLPGQKGEVLKYAKGPSPFGQSVEPAKSPPPVATLLTFAPPSAPPSKAATPASSPAPFLVYPPAPVSPPSQITPSAGVAPTQPFVSSPAPPASMPPPPPVAPLQASVSTASPSLWQSAGSAPAARAAKAVDGFINLGAGPFPAADTLATGNPQPWYNSPGVIQLFGGVPNAQQQANFASTVLQRVEQTYQLSNVPVKLSTDPNVPAAHTLSVVSNTSSNMLGEALGMTYVGGDGLSFIDQSAKSAQSVDQLEWIVAHNVSHELMLAFGVGENHDKSGNFIDAPTANLAMMLDPNATFSQSAAAALLASNFQVSNTNPSGTGAQVVGTTSAPEPATLAMWSILVVALALPRLRRRARVEPAVLAER
jgi:hypothetical protein